MPQLIIEEGQKLTHIWGMELDDEHIQIAFDCGDNGFLVLTHAEARELVETIQGLLPEEGGR